MKGRRYKGGSCVPEGPEDSTRIRVLWGFGRGIVVVVVERIFKRETWYYCHMVISIDPIH